MGNRDINKIRLLQELAPAYIAKYPLDRLPKPYWKQEEESSPIEDLKEDLDTDNVANTRANRLRYILKRTCGSAFAFELRQSYLLSLGEKADDDAVVWTRFLFLEGRGEREGDCLVRIGFLWLQVYM